VETRFATRQTFINTTLFQQLWNNILPLRIFTNMATTTQIRLRGRPAHTAGPTYLSYTPDGTKLVTVGSNNTTRVYIVGFDGEPDNIDDCQEQNMGVASTVCLPPDNSKMSH
jgi:WD40 repeat protein